MSVAAVSGANTRACASRMGALLVEGSAAAAVVGEGCGMATVHAAGADVQEDAGCEEMDMDDGAGGAQSGEVDGGGGAEVAMEEAEPCSPDLAEDAAAEGGAAAAGQCAEGEAGFRPEAVLVSVADGSAKGLAAAITQACQAQLAVGGRSARSGAVREDKPAAGGGPVAAALGAADCGDVMEEAGQAVVSRLDEQVEAGTEQQLQASPQYAAAREGLDGGGGGAPVPLLSPCGCHFCITIGICAAGVQAFPSSPVQAEQAS